MNEDLFPSLSEMNEKMESLRLLAASIAHQIKTPLASIDSLSNVVESALPTLLEAYEIALDTGKITGPLRNSQLEVLESLPEQLTHITSETQLLTDMLLAQMSFENTQGKSFPLRTLSIKEALMTTLFRYPFNKDSANLIKCNYKHDFKFMGDALLFQHVLFNLIKNAIYHVRSTGRVGEITIWFEQTGKENFLHFKDTGNGINRETLPLIFEAFYVRSPQDVGVGLPFCKLVIESFGGYMTCESVEGQYTHFKLSFPKVGNKAIPVPN